MPSEKAFETKLKKFLESEGCYCFKVWGGGMQKAGIPDLMICANGCFIAVEVKSDTGKPSPLQLYQIAQINEAGGVGLVLYPKHFDEFKRFITTLNQLDIATNGSWFDFEAEFPNIMKGR